jgi:hypothetical protein
MKRILSGDIPPPSSVNHQVDPQLERIITRALSLDPDDRYPSALDMQTELDEFVSTLGTPIGNQNLGRDLSSMFEDLRAERASSIDRRVAHATESVPPEETPFSVATPSEPKRPSKDEISHVAWVAAFFVGLTIFGGVLIWRQPVSQEAHHAQVSMNDPAPEAQTVRIRITAFPGEASLELDGQELGSNPYASSVRPSTQLHELIVSADGYQSETRSLRFNQDQEVVLTLKRTRIEVVEPEPSLDATSKKLSRPERTAPTRVQTISAPDPCDPPHFIDERGIKKFKPECL